MLHTMQDDLNTARLNIAVLNAGDAPFIFELLNSPGWIEFIGERNINTLDDARAYIQKIGSNPDTDYRVVKLNGSLAAVGIVTLIKRDYLNNQDIGFAFLPGHEGRGYAREAAGAFIDIILRDDQLLGLDAITVPKNARSIKLLEKLGFRFEQEMIVADEMLLRYTISRDSLLIDRVVRSLFSVFNNKTGSVQNWQLLDELCIPGVSIIRKSGGDHELYNLSSFVAPRKQLLSDGSLTQFQEWECSSDTKVINHIARRDSVYKKSGIMNGQYFEQAGQKLFHLIKIGRDWKISAIVWEDD